MGGTYGNIVMKNAPLDGVLLYLQQVRRTALVSQEVNAYCVIFEERSEFDFAEGKALALELSEFMSATALYVGLNDNDVLVYWLCINGVDIDYYDSSPGIFAEPIFAEGEIDLHEVSNYQPPRPEGGDISVLCATFDVPEATSELEQILRSRFTFETDRHESLVRL